MPPTEALREKREAIVTEHIESENRHEFDDDRAGGGAAGPAAVDPTYFKSRESRRSLSTRPSVCSGGQ
jgi:hypothetical protein